MEIVSLSTLKIHTLTQEQYKNALVNNGVNKNEIYLTPAEEIDLSEYAKRDEIPDITGKAEVEHFHSISDISDYVAPVVPTKVSELDNDSKFVTEDKLEDKGYLTEHQSLEGYAKTTDIPDVSSFITMTDIEAKKYATTDYVDTAMGDINSALDNIIAIQDSLIGGGV